MYQEYCSVCHGDRGDGNSRASASLDPPPRNFTAANAATELSRERMILSVTHGRPGTAMSGWSSQLSANQIASIVDYVRQSFMNIDLSPELERGRRIYAKTCAVCHGDRGNGTMWASSNLHPAPRDFTATNSQSELSRERMFASVTNGRPGTAMSSFARQLSVSDIAAVVDYIRSAFMHASSTSAALRPDPLTTHDHVAGPLDMHAPLPNDLRGNFAKGKAFYLGNCATCHGAKGDGNGPRAYFINPRPRNFVAQASRTTLNRPAIYVAVAAGKRGSEMPAWKTVLTEQEIADVSEFVFRAYIATDNAMSKR